MHMNFSREYLSALIDIVEKEIREQRGCKTCGCSIRNEFVLQLTVGLKEKIRTVDRESGSGDMCETLHLGFIGN